MAGLFCCLFGGSSIGGGDHTVAFSIAKDYGYVILVAVISSFLLMWQAMQVNISAESMEDELDTTNWSTFNEMIQ